jgi:hypothetical protein
MAYGADTSGESTARNDVQLSMPELAARQERLEAPSTPNIPVSAEDDLVGSEFERAVRGNWDSSPLPPTR